MAAVLVTDGEERAALAAVRSLGRAGHTVYVLSARGRSIAGASRSCRTEVDGPDPLAAPAVFVETVAGLIERFGIDVLCPITEASLRALLPHRDRLRPARIPFAETGTFARAADKEDVLATARGLGIAVPAQSTLATAHDAARLDVSTLSFPIVIKPAHSIATDNAGASKQTVSYATDARDLERELRSLPPAAYPVLLQERIVGPGCGVFLLVWNGEVRAVFAHQRIREKPPSGGVSVYRESARPDDALLEQATALLQRLEWQGVAMVEFKRDARRGTPYLMEINGRFWGSLQLAIDAGVDFPALLVALAMGEDPPRVSGYRVGVRSRWWWGDVDHLWIRLRHARRGLHLPPDAPPLWRAIAAFLLPWRPGDRFEVFRLTDPRPFIRETLQWFRPS